MTRRIAPPTLKPELTSRWKKLRPAPGQLAYARSKHRFNTVPAGRRSGKTERAKRKIVRRALKTYLLNHNETARFFAGAPTRAQAKGIWWEDLKKLSQPWWSKEPSESDLTIYLYTDAEIVVFGLDKPQRFEGQPWDGGVIDEVADIKPDAWSRNIRPALSDERQGWCDLIGVPEGRNHYYDLHEYAKAEMARLGDKSEWGAFTWFSSEVLDPKEIEAARRELDTLSFEQEYEASFINFTGRAYYTFTDQNKRAVRGLYNPTKPLIFMLDFNVQPGVAAVAQEAMVDGVMSTIIIGEVWIPDNSNTLMVCRRLLLDWGMHAGTVVVYGDATGGNRGSAKLSGSDWDVVEAVLTRGDGEFRGFGSRVMFNVPKANPSERARVNAVNTRFQNNAGIRRMYVDPERAPHVIVDFDGVKVVEGGSGELDKKTNKNLTHISDAVGYYIVYEFPTTDGGDYGTSAHNL